MLPPSCGFGRNVMIRPLSATGLATFTRTLADKRGPLSSTLLSVPSRAVPEPNLSSSRLSVTSSVALGREGPQISFIRAKSSCRLASVAEALLEAVAAAKARAVSRDRDVFTIKRVPSIRNIESNAKTISSIIPRRRAAA